jgi:hypothetical protein
MWKPFLEMRAFLEGLLSAPTRSVNLVQCNEVRDKAGSDYIVQSVDRTAGDRVEVYPYLLSRFF